MNRRNFLWRSGGGLGGIALAAMLHEDGLLGAEATLSDAPMSAPGNGAALEALHHPAKDVDGLHPFNLGLLLLGRTGLRPCTPIGIVRLLDHYEIPVAGRRAVVVGRSFLVGRPLALILSERGMDATVTMAHSRSEDLAEITKEADIVVVAAGKPGLVKGEWIKEGAIVIDVGINRQADGKLVGDVEYAVAAERAAWITPVPGGVGPMTRACLLENSL